MKKIMISMALLLSVGTIMGQVDKAALKQLQKEAKAQVAEAQKIDEAITAKINEKTATEEEIMSECKKAQALVRKAIKGGGVAENKLGEAYKTLVEMTFQPHNIMLQHAVNKEPFDTAFFYTNLKSMTDALQGEVKNTKVTKGEAGNEAHIKNRLANLAQCGDYYIYAAQFNSECGKIDKAIEAFDIAMNYTKKYPEVADKAQLRIPNEQIAYYAFHTAHEGKMYDKMDALYDEAVKFAEGALGTKQVRASSYLERGDSTAWANYVRDLTLAEPKANEDFIQMLIAYYLKKDKEAGPDSNLMMPYVDEILAKDPNILIAQYGKAYKYFESEKYDEAFAAYHKCAEIKDDYYDAWYQCGLCKYRQALALNATVSSIKNQTEAKKTLERTKALFGEAIPFFEKARECAPDEPMKWAFELRQCYSVTGQAAKAAEMDKLM
jgi:tetratricopeptide (TPR) repeat protein